MVQKKSLLFSILLLFITQIFAQTRGNNVSVTKSLPFQHSFQNVMLDPNPVTGSNSRVQFTNTFNPSKSFDPGLNTILNLIGGDVSIPGWLTDLNAGTSFFCSGVTPNISINGSIDVGGYYQVRSVGNANVDVNYPVQVTIQYPEANSFACGETIRISTGYTVLQPAANDKLRVKPPFVNQEIGPVINNLKFGATIGVDAYVGFGVNIPLVGEICSDKKYFNESVSFLLSSSLPTLPSLINFCERGFGLNATNATLLSCNWSALSPLLNLGQQTLDAYNASNNTAYTFAEFPDRHTVKIAPPDLPDGGPTIPEMEGTFKEVTGNELQYSSANGAKQLIVSGTKSFLSQMSFDLVSLLDYAGVTTSKSLGGGRGSIDLGDIAPTFTIDQNFNFQYNPVVHLQINLGAVMSYTVFNSNGTTSHSGNGQFVQLTAGQYIDAVVPQSQTAALNASGGSSLSGTFSSQSAQEYYRSIKLAFGEIKMPGVIDETLLSDEVFKSKVGEKGIIDHSFNLALPNSITLPNFVLDPENPVIDVSYLKVEDVRNMGAGKRQVVYKTKLINTGDVNLSNVQATIDLAAAFATSKGYKVICINSGDFIVNSSFNGASNKNLLASGNTLALNQTKEIEFIVEVMPAVSGISSSGCFEMVNYTVAAKATATSPIGTNITSDYNQCTMQTTGADITTTVDLGADVLSKLEDFTIYGWKGVVFDKQFNRSFGNAGSFADMIFENVSLQGSPSAVIVGDLHVKDRLRLLGESRVIVDYIQNTGTPIIANSKSSLTTTGAMSNNSGCVVSVPKPNLLKPVNNSTHSFELMAGSTRTLQPGAYQHIIVNENSTLILTAGVYYFDTWKFMGNNAKVKYQLGGQTITIHIDKFQPLQRNNLQMIIDGQGKVSDVVIYSYGNQLSKFNNSLVQGIIYAPHAEVEFENNSRLEGACYADKVNFRTGATFKGVRYTIPLNVNEACRQPVANTRVIAPPMQEASVVNVQQQRGIYPNPVGNLLTITGLNSNRSSIITVYDTQGRVVKQFKLKGAVLQLYMQDLINGVYLLKVDDSNEVFKIIKQ